MDATTVALVATSSTAIVTVLGWSVSHLLTTRRDDFLRQFCRKLLGFALGRSVQLSDKPLLDTMLRELVSHDYRVSVAIELIVQSPQFREVRGRDFGSHE